MVKRTKARKKSRKRKSRKRQKGGCGCAMSGGGNFLSKFLSFGKPKQASLPGRYDQTKQIEDEELRRRMEERRVRERERANHGFVGGKKKTKRKNRRKYRKTKKSKRKSKKKRRRKRQRGGSSFSCNYPKNLGAHFGNKLNASPFLPDPINSNTNIKSSMKGGGLWSDVKQYWWKGNNAVTNTHKTYTGDKHDISPDPMVQKLSVKNYDYDSFDFAGEHNTVSDEVSKLI